MADTVAGIGLGLGFLSLLLQFIVVALQSKFSNLKKSKFINSISNILNSLILFGGAIFILSLLWSALNQPTAFEACMQSAGNQTDPEAIDWLADYCSQKTG